MTLKKQLLLLLLVHVMVIASHGQFCPEGYRCDSDGTAHRCGAWHSGRQGDPITWYGTCPTETACTRLHLEDGTSLQFSSTCPEINSKDFVKGKNYKSYSRSIRDPKCPKDLPWRVETVIEIEDGKFIRMGPDSLPGHNCSRLP